jgi:hypothetical protein
MRVVIPLFSVKIILIRGKNHTLRVEITLVRFEITVVRSVITFVRVKITMHVKVTLCVYKSHS